MLFSTELISTSHIYYANVPDSVKPMHLYSTCIRKATISIFHYFRALSSHHVHQLFHITYRYTVDQYIAQIVALLNTFQVLVFQQSIIYVNDFF